MAYIFYNPNPSHQLVGDCVIRAISKVTGDTWEDTYTAISLQGFDDVQHIFREFLYERQKSSER